MSTAIERLEELERSATKGPRRTETHGRTDDEKFGAHYLFAEHSPYPCTYGHGEQEDGFRSLHGCSAPLYKADADLIVATRNALPSILRVLRAAKAHIAYHESPITGPDWVDDAQAIEDELREAVKELEGIQ